MGYDLRRKIRAQIRLVKKLIEENRLSIYVESLRRSSPKRESSPKFKPYKPEERKDTEYQTEYVRKSSPERKPVDNKLYRHTDLVDRRDSTVKTSEYQTSYTYNERRSSSEYTSSTRRSPSPVKVCSRERSPTTKLSPRDKKPESKTFTQLKKTVPITKTVSDDKPEWVRQRNLRKVTETTSTPVKKVTTMTTTTTRTGSSRKSPVKDVKPTDIITSSYGVGPTDENGAPLFGLKALRAQNKTEKTKGKRLIHFFLNLYLF